MVNSLVPWTAVARESRVFPNIRDGVANQWLRGWSCCGVPYWYLRMEISSGVVGFMCQWSYDARPTPLVMSHPRAKLAKKLSCKDQEKSNKVSTND
ncbi:hypothetical protein RIF29_25898 [Crotalaria pallida]|uniref:Uncharacterized protein n=1 Tax=Crotalaria pallida TaxID=3830 RepID=A0AAN9HZK2_CROPI